MPEPTFVSFSQNGEDVVLWRALKDVAHGRYVEVGANHPRIDSVSRAFYDRGWSGITVEPDPWHSQLQRDERPRDLQIEAAITSKDSDEIAFYVVDRTGLSTLDPDLALLHGGAGFKTHEVRVKTRRMDSVLEEAGWQGRDIHFMSVDTEGAEKEVLESFDLRIWRPWVLVVEATVPNSTASTRAEWEHLILSSGYVFCLFDGLSCFYVAEEHEAALKKRLSFPACSLDDYVTLEHLELRTRAGQADELLEEVKTWRAEAISLSNELVAATSGPLQHASSEVARLDAERLALQSRLEAALRDRQREIDDLHNSTSWRVTQPLRWLSGFLRSHAKT